MDPLVQLANDAFSMIDFLDYAEAKMKVAQRKKGLWFECSLRTTTFILYFVGSVVHVQLKLESTQKLLRVCRYALEKLHASGVGQST